MAETALRSVLAKLGFEIDTKKLDEGDKKFDKFFKRMTAGFGAMALFRGAKGLISETLDYGTQLEVTSKQLGMSIEQLQRYQYAGDQVGLSVQQMTTAFKTLENHMGAAKTLTGMSHGIKMFGQYGGQIKGTTDLLEKVADKMANIKSHDSKVRFANEMMGEMGFRMIPLLEKGSKGVREFYDEFKTLELLVSEDFVKAAAEAQRKLKTLHTTFRVFKSEAVIALLPVIVNVSRWLARATSWLTKMARATTFSKTAWVAFGAAILSMTAIAAGGFNKLFLAMLRVAWPILLFGVLYLIFDDLYNLMKGNRSLTGVLIKELMGAEQANRVAEDLRKTWNEVKKLFIDLAPIAAKLGLELVKLGVESLPFVMDGFLLVVKLIGAAVRGVSFLVKGIVGSVKAFAEANKEMDPEQAKLEGYKTKGEKFMALLGQNWSHSSLDSGLDDLGSGDYWNRSDGSSLFSKRRYQSDAGNYGVPPTTNNIEINVSSTDKDMPKKVEKAVKKAVKPSLGLKSGAEFYGADPSGG